MTTREAITILKNEYDNAEIDGIKEACGVALDALQLMDIMQPDALRKCAHCGDYMYGLVRVHHHTELIDGEYKDVTNNY